MHYRNNRMNRKQQSGAVLAVSLIILLLLTILGVASMRTTTLEERMAGNAQSLNRAFQAAEAALRDGESYLTAATLPTFDGTGGLYQPADATLGQQALWKTISWSSSTATRAYSGTVSGVSTQPRYFIEELVSTTPSPGESLASDTPVVESRYYRITARGTGGNDTSVVILESVYKR